MEACFLPHVTASVILPVAHETRPRIAAVCSSPLYLPPLYLPPLYLPPLHLPPRGTTDRDRFGDRPGGRVRGAAGRGERRDRRDGPQRVHQRQRRIPPERPGGHARRACAA